MAKTKIECARMVAEGRADETFDHETLGHFNITELRALIMAVNARREMPRHRCRFDEVRAAGQDIDDGTAWLFAQREIDISRAAMFTDEQLDEPLIFLLCPPGSNGESESHLLVDGIHRLYERKRRGRDDFVFYLFPLELAPRAHDGAIREIKWGEKDLIPGVGLVTRERS